MFASIIEFYEQRGSPTTNHNHDHDHNQSSSSSSSSSSSTSNQSRIFRLARQHNWDKLMATLQEMPSEMIESAVDDEDGNDEEYHLNSSILHVLFSWSMQSSNVPLSVISTIVSLAPALASKPNANQQTPLHLVVQSMPGRNDIVQCLVDAAAPFALVHQVDETHQKPIDILSRKIIMMEEVTRWSALDTDRMEEVMRVWDTVHVIANASSSSSYADDSSSTTTSTNIPNQQRQPIISACLLAKDFPFALIDRVMKRYKDQLLENEPNNNDSNNNNNANGDLPLHVIAATRPPPSRRRKGGDDEEDDDDDDDDYADAEENDFLDRVLVACPQAASRRNRHNQTPLQLAIQNGREWDTGVARLIEAYPAGLYDLEIPLSLYPNVMERFGGYNSSSSTSSTRRGQADTIFGILQTRPEIFSPPPTTATDTEPPPAPTTTTDTECTGDDSGGGGGRQRWWWWW